MEPRCSLLPSAIHSATFQRMLSRLSCAATRAVPLRRTFFTSSAPRAAGSSHGSGPQTYDMKIARAAYKKTQFPKMLAIAAVIGTFIGGVYYRSASLSAKFDELSVLDEPIAKEILAELQEEQAQEEDKEMDKRLAMRKAAGGAGGGGGGAPGAGAAVAPRSMKQQLRTD